MAEVTVQRIDTELKKTSRRKLYATVCYYYPQYTLREAQDLPARDVKLLINTALQINAAKLRDLTNIAAAPHTEKGKGVKKLLDHFTDIAKD